MMIEINLLKDFKEILKAMISENSKRLKEMKYEQKIKILDNADELCLLHMNLNRRLIESKPRAILKSKEFNCPKELENNLRDLENRIIKGEDLTPFLSRKLKKLDFPDATLNEWGIYHLHLGGFKGPKRLSWGQNEILFAIFDENHFYFIQVLTHKDWTNKEIINIVHRNWPSLIARFKIRTNSFEKTSDSDRELWRKGGTNTPIIMDDGTTYFCPGGGMVITQYNIIDRHYCNILIKNLKQVEKDIFKGETVIKSKIKEIYKISQNSLEFKLDQIIIDKNNLEYRIRELNSGLGIAFKGENVIFYKL
ncbi:MAG: hypothetical protein ACFFG0_33875 [Candidatus Thorarchaeota archaeon]